MALPRVAALNHWCAQQGIALEFLYIGRQSPRLVNAGPVALADAIVRRAAAIANNLRHDELHALLDIAGPQDFAVMRYQTLLYSQMLALREAGQRPTGLSATVLPFNPHRQTLLWQQRSAHSHLFPNYISLLGGGFSPDQDNDDPRVTARRECSEESGLDMVVPDDCLVTLTRETDSGAVQINYLGVAAEFAGACADEREGLLVETGVPVDVLGLEKYTALALGNLWAWMGFR